MTAVRRLTAIVLAAAVLAGCGSGSSGSKPAQPGKGKPPVVLGTKNFTEQYILGQLYLQALQARGYKVTLRNSIGPTEVTHKQLLARKVDLYPEYTGTIVGEVQKSRMLPASAPDAYNQAKAFEEQHGVTMLDMTPFSDRNAVAVKPAFAAKFGVRGMADLARAGRVRYGAPPENKNRFNGFVGMRRVYGLNNLIFVGLPIGEQYKDLDAGKIDAAAVFTTDGNLQTGNYVVLSDPQGVFGFQNAAPIVRTSVLSKEGPEFAATLNAVSRTLTTLAMQRLNAAVALDKQSPAAVARQYLKSNGLI